MNQVNRILSPISGARLIVLHPYKGEIARTSSDERGGFAFRGLDAGVYVLHVDGGEDIEPYDPFDNVIRLDPKALHRSLRLTRIEAYAGTCGGPHLRPETP